MRRLATIALAAVLGATEMAQAQTLYNPGCSGIVDMSARLQCEDYTSGDPGGWRHRG